LQRQARAAAGVSAGDLSSRIVISMPRPTTSEHAPYYGRYVALVPEDDILNVLQAQSGEAKALLRSIPEAQASILHPPYTWTIKQVVGHLIDGERIFAYRALRFARGDATPLPGFDENIYARTGEFERVPLKDLADEFDVVRQSTLSLFRNLPDAAWTRTGEANGAPASVRALAFIIAGHVRHHLNIVRQRVGKGAVMT
jgi:hypothetical protein